MTSVWSEKALPLTAGGISLKPANGMWDMKGDMTGAAVVVASLKALALQRAPVNAAGIVGLVENMPSGSATRPGDVVTSMSGQTDGNSEYRCRRTISLG